MIGPYTITAKPGEWRFVNAYEAFDSARYDHGSSSRERFSVVLTGTSLLPEEVANEVNISRNGSVYLSGFKRPAVEHHLGWETLEAELRRMEATNRSKDSIFDGATLEITFEVFVREPRPGSHYTTPLVFFPVTLIRIVGEQA